MRTGPVRNVGRHDRHATSARPGRRIIRACLAVRPEPAGASTAGARDPLAAEVRLLGSLLGQVVAEQAGSAVRARRAHPPLGHLPAPGRRPRGPSPPRRRSSTASTSGHPRQSSRRSPSTSSSSTWPRRAGACGRASARARRARRRPRRLARRGDVDAPPRRPDDADLDAALRELSIALVLTAHPTEARRRTTLLALRRCAALLDQLDDPRLTPAGGRDMRRRLREEISLLWRTSDLRAVAPTPIDEVRTAMAFFDATLFTLVPASTAGSTARSTRRCPPPRGRADAPAGPARGRRASSRFCTGGAGSAAIATATPGSPPTITEGPCASTPITCCAATSGAARLMQTVSAAVAAGPGVAPARAPARPRRRRLLPETDRQLRRRFPDEPYRQRFGFIAERLRRTRAALTGEAAARTGATPTPAELEPSSTSCGTHSSRTACRGRIGRRRRTSAGRSPRSGSTASLEIRQHSAVHRRRSRRSGRGRPGTTEVRRRGHPRRGPRDVPGDRARRRRGWARCLPSGSRQLHRRPRAT